ncbi:ABC transporter permease [Croceimicrobium hydrocarbonivorans]|uniref:ABC transporter permease n=1 Tax=Croceimicrobium hydrocarbonivorans TaxID=2761580 RepID=A0A7H0VFJ4_9FLAO|nr:ABC transporter permease [Croceimicrobium hydrocarbonivorans]QNR24492.1 ABC transporter permease [Croceimicrobium hydrocarbonivorans]
MMRLIAIEWYKLRTHRFFWWGMGLFLVLLSVLLWTFGKIPLPGGGPKAEDAADAGLAMMLLPRTFEEAGFYRLPLIWQNATFWASFFKFIPAFLLLFFVSSEFEYRTYRQNIIDGLSVGQFFLSKVFTLVLFSVLSTIVVGITIVVLAYANNDMADANLWAESSFLIGYFMETFFILCMALFLGFLTKKSVITIVILIMYYYVVEQFLGYWLSEPGEAFFDYLPTRPSRGLVPEPISRILDFFGQQEAPSLNWHMWWVSLAYSLVFLFSSYFLIRKRDL